MQHILNVTASTFVIFYGLTAPACLDAAPESIRFDLKARNPGKHAVSSNQGQTVPQGGACNPKDILPHFEGEPGLRLSCVHSVLPSQRHRRVTAEETSERSRIRHADGELPRDKGDPE